LQVRRTYASCLTSNTCTTYLNAFSTSCIALEPTCPSLVCPTTTDPCTLCANTYVKCSQSTSTELDICSCVSPYVSCLSSNTCVGSDVICGSYAGVCQNLPCTIPTTGCGSCAPQFASCVSQNPSNACNCLSGLLSCTSSNCAVAGTSSQFDITCPIYQAECPSIQCNNVTETGCTGCAVSGSVCIIDALKTGTVSGVCSCLSTMFDCLSSSTCGLTPYNGMCGAYGSLCSDLQCSSSTQSNLPNQIVALLQQYQTAVENYLAGILDGNVTFGASVQVGNSQTISITVDIPNSATIDAYFASLKSSLATYLNIQPGSITIEYKEGGNSKTIKRQYTSQQAQVTFSSSSSAIFGSFLFILVLLVLLF